MKLDVIELESGKAGSIVLSDNIFGIEPRKDILHRVVRWQLARKQQGTHSVLTRSEVSYSTKKIYRQKGTGRARAGTIRSPIWRGGGATFAAKPRDYSQKVNKKMYRGAMQSILSELVRQDRMVVTDNFAVDAPKTKQVQTLLNDLELESVLVVVEEVDDNLYLGARNLKNVEVVDVQGVNPVTLIGYEKVLFTVGALKQVEEVLG